MVQLVSPAFFCFVIAVAHSVPATTAAVVDTDMKQQATQDVSTIQQDSQHQAPVLPDTDMPHQWTSTQQQFETSSEQQSSLSSSSGADAITINTLPEQANPEPSHHHQNSTEGVKATSSNATSPAPSSPAGDHEEAGHGTPENNQKTRTPQAAAVTHHRKHDMSGSCSGDHDSSGGGSREDMEIDSLSKQQSEHPIPTTSESPAALELPPLPSDHDLSLQNVKTSSSTRPRSSALCTATAIAAMTAVVVFWSVGNL